MNSIDIGGQMSKVKVMKGIIDKCGVRGDATLCVVSYIIQFISHICMNWSNDKFCILRAYTCVHLYYF